MQRLKGEVMSKYSPGTKHRNTLVIAVQDRSFFNDLIIPLPTSGKFMFGNYLGKTYIIKEGVAVKVPLVKELDAHALCLGPRRAVGQWGEQGEHYCAKDKEGHSGDAVDESATVTEGGGDSCRHKVEHLAERNDGEVEGREIVVQEKLTLHQEEGEVMQGPAQDGGTNLIIETLECAASVVIASALPSENGNTLEDDPNRNDGRARPPDERVANEVDLHVVLAPEVDTTTKDRP